MIGGVGEREDFWDENSGIRVGTMVDWNSDPSLWIRIRHGIFVLFLDPVLT